MASFYSELDSVSSVSTRVIYQKNTPEFKNTPGAAFRLTIDNHNRNATGAAMSLGKIIR